MTKTLHNSDISGARKNVKDIVVVGNGDAFRLLCKASSKSEGWMKSTKAMEITGVGCVVQVTTHQRNHDGTNSVAEAVTFVPGAVITDDENNGRKLIVPSTADEPCKRSKGCTEEAIERQIEDKGLTAPRITPDMLDSEIVSQDYHVFKGSCLTVCCLTLKNGFTITGESACASPENFNDELGRDIAFKNAREKLWAFLGFRLRDKLSAPL
ncbi:Gp49 family protein [Polycladidibacter hongkongensis]|uniref:Gp49 family protein n=1 Tax=Polycladidibacter hongkongensis TaxID=1647556 RepID=UPI000AF2C88A|nr:Gp49 family protein [Pseudovibrio hongkongensis]